MKLNLKKVLFSISWQLFALVLLGISLISIETGAQAPSRVSITGVSIVSGIQREPDPIYGPIPSGAEIDRDYLPEIFNLEANVEGVVGSLFFELDGGVRQHTENAAPYSLFGDNPTSLVGGNLSNGDHTLKITAYSGRQRRGKIIATYNLNFSIYTTYPSDSTFSLLNPLSDLPLPGLTKIRDGETVDLRGLSSIPQLLAVQVFAFPTVGSVLFYVNGQLARIENYAPFALFGDDGGNFSGGSLPPGSNIIQARLYAGPFGSGSLLKTSTIQVIR